MAKRKIAIQFVTDFKGERNLSRQNIFKFQNKTWLRAGKKKGDNCLLSINFIPILKLGF